MTTVIGFCAIAAFICMVIAAINKAPLWIAVAFLCIIELLRILPLGH